MLNSQNPGMYPSEFEYYWQKRQTERLLDTKKKITSNALYYSQPLYSPKGAVLPAINPYRFDGILPVASQSLAAAKLEIDGTKETSF